MELLRRGFEVRAAVRRNPVPDGTGKPLIMHVVGDIGPDTDWAEALVGVQTVIHLAARVHVMKETARDPLMEFRRVNTLGTTRLGSMAAAAGVRRLIYVSTIKVNGEETSGTAFREDDPACPSDPYAISKLEAEQSLRRISAETGLEIVIVRPPLVYGPGVGGNFLGMLKWIDRGIPLPVASVHNQRSLIGLDNLVSLLVTCLSHTKAPGELFLAADGEDLSTPDLMRRTARALGTRARLLPFPLSVLRVTARLSGLGGACERLCGSLQVDAGKSRRLLGWQPALSVDEGLQAVARWYRHGSSEC